MKKLLYLLAFLLAQATNAHFKTVTDTTKYNYGKDGIESIIYRKGKPTILISNFHARPELVKDVVALVQEYYMKNQHLDSGFKTSFKTKKAEVFGEIIVKKSKTAIEVQFHYEKVFWKNGLVEIYEKPKKK